MIGGIIGTDIVRYDIYGPDVMIANKMESGGKTGHINVSEKTRYWLEKSYSGMYRFEPHEKLHVKSLGRNIESFLVYSSNDDKSEMHEEVNHMEIPIEAVVDSPEETPVETPAGRNSGDSPT